MLYLQFPQKTSAWFAGCVLLVRGYNETHSVLPSIGVSGLLFILRLMGEKARFSSPCGLLKMPDLVLSDLLTMTWIDSLCPTASAGTRSNAGAIERPGPTSYTDKYFLHASYVLPQASFEVAVGRERVVHPQ